MTSTRVWCCASELITADFSRNWGQETLQITLELNRNCRRKIWGYVGIFRPKFKCNKNWIL